MKTKKYTYESDEIVVAWDKELCTHAAECVRGLPAVFQRDRRPWIDPTLGTADEIARVIHRCPTGALTYERLDGGATEEQRSQVRALPNGPYVVRGDVVVMDEAGEVLLQATRVALCRCGGSSNKPFCDGTHKKNGFTAPAEEGLDVEAEPGEPADGKLRVYMQPGGGVRFA